MIAGAILLSLACWAFTFGVPWGNFWVKIGISVVIICSYSLFWQRPKFDFNPTNLLSGVLSAVLLYGIFAVGNFLAPYIIPGAGSQVGGIYDLGTGTDRIYIFLLLCFITGPGEEIFWRGFLQENLMQRFGAVRGFVTATLIYGGVHLFSMNLMLILAALVAGAFWGLLYLWKRDLGLVIASHSLWSAFIFAVFPVH